MAFLEPKHLRAGAEAEAELRDHWRGLQPAARRRRRNHIAGGIDNIEMHGVAARIAEPADSRLAAAEPAHRRLAGAGRKRHGIAAQLHHRAKPFDRARTLFE